LQLKRLNLRPAIVASESQHTSSEVCELMPPRRSRARGRGVRMRANRIEMQLRG
jgi:hypothetical protein